MTLNVSIALNRIVEAVAVQDPVNLEPPAGEAEASQLTLKAYFFRPYEPDDIPFIQSSWGHSYYDGVNGNRFLNPQEFHNRHRPIRERILNKPNVAIIICCAKEAPSLIIGYAILEKPSGTQAIILHYLYVKQAFKTEKIAVDLILQIKDRPVLYTHSTIKANKIMNRFKLEKRKELERFLFAPHLI